MDRDRFLLLSQDPALAAACAQVLQGGAAEVVEVRDSGRLPTLLARGASLVLVDLNLPDRSLQTIAEELAGHRELPVVVLAAGSTAAWDRLSRGSPLEQAVPVPIDGDRLPAAAGRLLERTRFLRDHLVGDSEAMQTLREQILLAGPTPVTVLITGESGAGKDVVARALHHFSGRDHQPYKPINCAAIPENLLENELFGHERGAFTDARAQTRGIFEQADGGTVFLDEIGEMARSAQVRLLRVLEERRVTRIGGDESIEVDVRMLAASNKDLLSSVSRGEFRRDLYHRLKVVELYLPPLRERRPDIPLLLDHFVEIYGRGQEGGPRFSGFTRAALDMLTGYDWPGNVRELRNLVEHLVFLGPAGEIDADDLLPHLEQAPSFGVNLPVPTLKTPDQSERELIYFALLDLKREVADLRRLMEEGGGPAVPRAMRPVYQVDERSEAAAGPVQEEDNGELPSLKELERDAIARALEQVGHNRRKAAELLGIGERTLYRKLDKYGFK